MTEFTPGAKVRRVRGIFAGTVGEVVGTSAEFGESVVEVVFPCASSTVVRTLHVSEIAAVR